MVDKRIIKNNFSRCARYYDKYSTIQKICAQELLDRVTVDGFKKILDIGCGTGNYTRLLKDRFPAAHIMAIDISNKMIEIAKSKIQDGAVEFIIADAEVIDYKTQFDLVSSNASFQWFEDLEKTLSRYGKLLSKNGLILFSTFGPLTFIELNESLKELSDRGISVSACSFIKKVEIAKILRKLFKGVEIDEQRYKEVHPSLSALLKKIRYTGTRGNGLNRGRFWTSDTVDKLEKIYKQRFKDITATYQVFFCKGKR